MKKTVTYSSAPQTLDDLIEDLQKIRGNTNGDVRIERLTFNADKYQESLGPYYKTYFDISVEGS